MSGHDQRHLLAFGEAEFDGVAFVCAVDLSGSDDHVCPLHPLRRTLCGRTGFGGSRVPLRPWLSGWSLTEPGHDYRLTTATVTPVLVPVPVMVMVARPVPSS